MKYFFLTIFLTFSLTTSIHAASLTVSIPQDPKKGSDIVVDVMLDPEAESINSADVTLSFPSNLLTFSGYSASDSIIPIWIQSPRQDQAGKIHFSGIIPGGVDRLYDPEHPENKNIRLVRLLFSVGASGIGTVDYDSAILLKNDGRGTNADVTTKGTTLTIADAMVTLPTARNNNQVPEPFTITILPRSIFGKTPMLAVFSATGGDGGVQRYEGRFNSRAFTSIESPYAIPRHIFEGTLTVRAYDFDGDYREQTVSVPGVPMVTLIFWGVLLAGVMLFYIYKKKAKGS